jgi:voltage-gated potassium channel
VSVAFFSVIVWFASLNFALYQLQHDQFNGIGSFGDALYYSIITATTVGYGDISPAKPLARLSCAGETLVGLFYILIGIGRFSGMFTKERPGVETR